MTPRWSLNLHEMNRLCTQIVINICTFLQPDVACTPGCLEARPSMWLSRLIVVWERLVNCRHDAGKRVVYEVV